MLNLPDQLVVVIAALRPAPDPTYTCGICGFVMNELGECPLWQLVIEETAEEWRREGKTLVDDVKAFLTGDEDKSGE